MKKMILVFILALPLVLKAQSPGYQGKHFILSYSPDITFANYLVGIIPVIPFEAPDGIFIRHNIMAEYVLSRKISIGAEYTFLNQNAITGSDDQINGNSYSLNIASGSFALDLILYTSDNNPIAPVGNYLKFKVFINNYTAKANSINSDSLPADVKNPQSVTGQTFGVGVGFGHNHIVAGRVLITYGASLDYNFNLTPNQATLNQRVYEHLFGAYIFPALRFGVGGLLF